MSGKWAYVGLGSHETPDLPEERDFSQSEKIAQAALMAFQAIFANVHDYYHSEFPNAPLKNWLALCEFGEKSSVQLSRMLESISTPENSFRVLGVKKYKPQLLGRKPENNWYFEAEIEQKYQSKTFTRSSTQYYSENNKHMFQ